MLRRFTIFFISFGVGSLFVYLILIRGKDRNLGYWLPDNRILTEMEGLQFQYDENNQCNIKCLGGEKGLKEILLNNADVNFKLSKPRNTPKQYLVENETASFFASIINKDSTVIVHTIIPNSNITCDCK